MKLIAIALFLGCTAMVCTFAVRSDSFHFEPLTFAQFPSIRLPFSCLWHAFSPAAPSQLSAERSETASIPLLSKAEALLLIADAAAKHRVPAAFVTSIVAAESNFNSAAISPKGAIGLMQLMPDTAKQFGADPTVPAENVDAGTRYLRWLMERYQNRRSSIRYVIAAYNAGPGSVDRYRGVPPFRETRAYVSAVLSFLKQFSPPPQKHANRRTGRPRHFPAQTELAAAKVKSSNL
jgi:soluble lytic murein transglycosylase-like protein